MSRSPKYILDTNAILNTPITTSSGMPDYLAYVPNEIGSSGSFHMSLTISESTEIDIIQEYTWRSSPVPMWSSVLKKLKEYESRYNLPSEEMYESYKTNQIAQKDIPSRDLRDWVNSYLLYAY